MITSMKVTPFRGGISWAAIAFSSNNAILLVQQALALKDRDLNLKPIAISIQGDEFTNQLSPLHKRAYLWRIPIRLCQEHVLHHLPDDLPFGRRLDTG